MKIATFLVADHSGNYHLYTAKDLRDTILEDAENSHYNWHAPASELARVTTKSSFPVDYAEDIQCAVLECYQYFIATHRSFYAAEKEAIWRCFHSLRVKDSDKARKACQSFIKFLIIQSMRNASVFKHLHPGEQYGIFCEKFREEKYAEWQDKQGKDLEKWAANLHEEFESEFILAEQNGEFEESDKLAFKEIANTVFTVLDYY